MLTAPEIVIPRSREWHELVLHDLTAVEDFLDRLERCGCQCREVQTLGASDFAVRWYS